MSGSECVHSLLTLFAHFCSRFAPFSRHFLTLFSQFARRLCSLSPCHSLLDTSSSFLSYFLSFLSPFSDIFSLPCFAVLRAGVLHTVRALPAAETLQQSAEQPAGDRDVRRRLGHLRGNDRAPFSNDMSLICSQIPHFSRIRSLICGSFVVSPFSHFCHISLMFFSQVLAPLDLSGTYHQRCLHTELEWA